MNVRKIPLELIEVASPCTASWDAMHGDDHARFCGQCTQYVYDLSGMTRADAEAIVLKHEGKLCVRFYRRADGTVLTADCPVGLAVLKRRASNVAWMAAAAIFALLSLFAFGATYSLGRVNEVRRDRIPRPIVRVLDWLFPPEPCLMGMPVIPAPPDEQPVP